MTSDYKGVCHPWLCDSMGHLTTRHYMAMFDDASYHFLNRVFGWSGTDSQNNNVGWADVKHTIEYLLEVRSGQLLDIKGVLAKVGGKSITVSYEMRECGSHKIVATLTSISVLFDTEAREAITLTNDMRIRANKSINETTI
jgi:acyl-CoA thioester hydrolase